MISQPSIKDFYDRHLKAYIEDDSVAVCIIFLFAFFLRLSFLPHLLHDPAFIHPVVDAKEHNDLAFEILNINQWRINKFWYHTPGYAYFVAIVYKLLGHSVVRLAFVQYVLGSLCACLVYFMVKRLAGRAAALFAGVLMSAYWMLIYTQSHVYSENLSMLLNLLTVYFLMFSTDSWRKYLLSGMLLGASVVVRPEMLPFAAVLWLWLVVRRAPIKAVVKYYGLFLVGVSFCVLPLLIRNHQLSGNFLLREQIGVNFYMGSLSEFKGSNIYVTIGRKWEDVIQMPYLEQGIYDRNLSEKELNAFYVGKVLDHIKSDPFAWAGFIAAKIFSVAVGIDFLRTEDVYFYDAYIRGGLYSLVQTWLICILALIGIFLALKREPADFLLPALFLASYLPAVLFTYKTRYLVSLAPLLIIFSSYAFAVFVAWIRRRQWARAAAMACIFLSLYAGVRLNPLEIHWPSQSEMYYVIGVNFEYYGDYAKAEEYFLKALELDPGYVSAFNDLGVVQMQTGQFTQAAVSFQKAMQLRHVARYRDNYLRALEYAQKGGTYDFWDYHSAPMKEHISLYHYYFPYPYQGAIYQKIIR